MVKITGVYQQVTKVHHTMAAGDIHEHHFHKVFKVGWCIAETEQYHSELPQYMSQGEGSLVLHQVQAVLASSHCPCQRAKPTGPTDLVKGIVDSWYGL